MSLQTAIIITATNHLKVDATRINNLGNEKERQGRATYRSQSNYFHGIPGNIRPREGGFQFNKRPGSDSFYKPRRIPGKKSALRARELRIRREAAPAGQTAPTNPFSCGRAEVS